MPAFNSSLERFLYEVIIPKGSIPFFTFIGRITRLPKPLMTLFMLISHIAFFVVFIIVSI